MTKNVPTNSDKTEKELRDRNETPILNQGQKSLAKVYSRPIVYELNTQKHSTTQLVRKHVNNSSLIISLEQPLEFYSL